MMMGLPYSLTRRTTPLLQGEDDTGMGWRWGRGGGGPWGRGGGGGRVEVVKRGLFA